MTNQTTDAAGPSPREIMADVVYANSDGGPLRVGLTCANAIIAALESAGYQITRQRAVLQREEALGVLDP
jgi:hypothetical protein